MRQLANPLRRPQVQRRMASDGPPVSQALSLSPSLSCCLPLSRCLKLSLARSAPLFSCVATLPFGNQAFRTCRCADPLSDGSAALGLLDVPLKSFTWLYSAAAGQPEGLSQAGACWCGRQAVHDAAGQAGWPSAWRFRTDPDKALRWCHHFDPVLGHHRPDGVFSVLPGLHSSTAAGVCVDSARLAVRAAWAGDRCVLSHFLLQL